MSVGTIKKVVLDGTTFDAMADANLNQIKGKYTNEEVVTSSKIVQKKTLRAQKVESTNLQCDEEEAEELKSLSESSFSFPMSYETAAGVVFRTTGFIDFEGHDTDAGLAVIKMIPESIDGWAKF